MPGAFCTPSPRNGESQKLLLPSPPGGLSNRSRLKKNAPGLKLTLSSVMGVVQPPQWPPGRAATPFVLRRDP